MLTKAAYFVIDTTGTRPRVDRVRASWPSLEPGEIIVRLALNIPDSLLPSIQDIQIEDIEAIGIAVEPVALEA